MKNSILALQILFLVNFSCNGQYYDTTYVRSFKENKILFEKTVAFLKAQQVNIDFSIEKAVVFYDTSLLNNPKFVSPMKESLKDFFSSNKFKSISYYSSGEIEFLMDLKIDDLTSTETKMLILFSDNNELPLPYIQWKKNKKIETNWWYLENADSQY